MVKILFNNFNEILNNYSWQDILYESAQDFNRKIECSFKGALVFLLAPSLVWTLIKRYQENLFFWYIANICCKFQHLKRSMTKNMWRIGINNKTSPKHEKLVQMLMFYSRIDFLCLILKAAFMTGLRNESFMKVTERCLVNLS